jgi:hypothetical protein
MKSFEAMTPQERMRHMLGDHRLPDIKAAHEGLSDAEIIEAHQLDHDEYIADEHTHAPA